MRLPLYLSAPQPCSYLAGEYSQSLFIDPEMPMTVALYSQLVRQGFRRSGGMVYRPHCLQCRQCLSARIPVADFQPRRRHRRTLRANRALRLVPTEARFREEHFRLYQRYTASRHAGGSMADSEPSEYQDFLITDWCDTHFLEFREDHRLLGVAVTDQLRDGLSAVYTFFDPDLPSRSLGTWGILAQLDLCRQLQLPYLYLGYWVRDCAKMRYKADFRPLELFSQNRWCRFEQGEQIRLPELPE
ncbi:MAG: arginyltransferase [Gammaproteobacteria bacterium]|nr:MAG: arginyltransferase [Gammaproteobacteria bacterium]